jgi:hypothetical protein
MHTLHKFITYIDTLYTYNRTYIRKSSKVWSKVIFTQAYSDSFFLLHQVLFYINTEITADRN